MLQISHNLRLIRETAEMSRREFAEYLNIIGVTYNTLQNFETGRTEPSPMIVKEMADKIGINETDLLNKKLTKKEIPVIVIKKTTQVSAPVDDILRLAMDDLRRQLDQKQMELDRKQIELDRKQMEVDRKQSLIEHLLKGKDA